MKGSSEYIRENIKYYKEILSWYDLVRSLAVEGECGDPATRAQSTVLRDLSGAAACGVWTPDGILEQRKVYITKAHADRLIHALMSKKSWYKDPVTEKQRRLLQSMGCTVPSTKGEASVQIDLKQKERLYVGERQWAVELPAGTTAEAYFAEGVKHVQDIIREQEKKLN